jgi:uncharacterized protein (DUF2147 family)
MRVTLRATFILLSVALAATFSFWWWESKYRDLPSASLPASEAAAKSEIQKLKGKWIRPDGGYVVEIKRVDDGGNMDAAYFNPYPIHVSRAQASTEGGAIRVFIELRAQNYPGSTYTLMYDPERDQLQGIYYQALQQQSYEVAFVRME